MKPKKLNEVAPDEALTIPEHVEVVPVTGNAIEAMERATVDMQISTAHKYPRSISLFLTRAKEAVSVDYETAESCIYRRPVGKDESEGGQKWITGCSIRLAEIVASCYGNLRVGAIITEITPRFVKAVGFAHDLESNYAAKAEVVEATIRRTGQPYSERMRVVAAKAAQSKAMRDAIFRVVPKSMWVSVVEAAKQIIAGKERPLLQRQQMVTEWLKKLEIEPERVFAAIGVSCVKDMTNEHLLALTGIRTALKDGDITLDEAFPPIAAEAMPQAIKSGIEGLKAKLAAKKRGRPPKATITTSAPDAEVDPEIEVRKKEQIDSLRKPEADAAEQKYRCNRCNKIITGSEMRNEQCPHCLGKQFEIE